MTKYYNLLNEKICGLSPKIRLEVILDESINIPLSKRSKASISLNNTG